MKNSCYILWSFGIYYFHLVHLCQFGNSVAIWYISPHFGILNKEKSGNPGKKLEGIKWPFGL
jgi:hypothetical protein